MSSSYAATLAICYLRKMRQWNEGKIDLAVPGEDPPYRMDQAELDAAMEQMIALRDAP